MRQTMELKFMKIDQIETSYSYLPPVKVSCQFEVLKLVADQIDPSKELQAPEIARV